MGQAAITGFGAAFPKNTVTQNRAWEKFFRNHFCNLPAAEKIWKGAGVETRHAAVDPTEEDVSLWPTEQRMQRFGREALPLAAEAVRKCLAQAGLSAGDVEMLAVASCTGYLTPGLDILVAREIGMAPSVQRVQIGHMGCYAAIPGLQVVHDAAAARGKTAVLVCAELPSLHLQPPGDGLDQVVAHALFADAAAAVAVQAGRAGLCLVDVTAHTDAAEAEKLTWDITGHGFRMGLSPQVPAALGGKVRGVIENMISRHGLGLKDVAGWAVHPGGPRIVDIVGEQLDLGPRQLSESRSVLREQGNCSSATVLLILQRLLEEKSLNFGDHVVALAFGPGLTLYAALLKRS